MTEPQKQTALQKALALSGQAYETVRRTARPGKSETQVMDEVRRLLLESPDAAQAIDFDFVSGERAGSIGGRDTGRILRAGDALIFDLCVCVGGVWCDTTRTFFMGEPDGALRAGYAAVLNALEVGAERLRPGISGEELWRDVSGALSRRGYGALPHHAGHIVGAQSLEEPEFLPGKTGTLQAGTVAALEPGVYFKGQNGIRVENNWRIGPQGAELLFAYPTALDYFILEG